MIPPGSRYEDAEHAFTQSHLYNQWGYPYLDNESPNLKIEVVNRETTYRVMSFSFETSDPPQEYYVKDGENIQWLAFKFMRDPGRWHEIAEANSHVWYPLDMPMATYIRVPSVS
jgi:hypothetical protein